MQLLLGLKLPAQNVRLEETNEYLESCLTHMSVETMGSSASLTVLDLRLNSVSPQPATKPRLFSKGSEKVGIHIGFI